MGVIGRGPGKATIYRRIEGDLSGRVVFDAAAAPLPGCAKPAEFVFLAVIFFRALRESHTRRLDGVAA
jgi:hypothetical protein